MGRISRSILRGLQHEFSGFNLTAYLAYFIKEDERLLVGYASEPAGTSERCRRGACVYQGRAVSAFEAEVAGAAKLLAARAWLYELAYKCFGGEPNEALLAEVCGSQTRAAVVAYAQDCEQMAGLAKLLDELAEQDAATLLDAARDEYTRMFEGLGALPAPPCRAPYTGSRDAALFQEVTLAVRELYRAQGLRMRREQAVPDDHVVALLDFAARQAMHLFDAFAAGDAGFAVAARVQYEIAQGFMADWLGEYARLVRNSRVGSHAVLYPQLLEAVDAFTQVDCVFLGEVAYWFEQQAPKGDCARKEAPANIPTALKGCDAVAVREAAGRLSALRLIGLEDNELTELDRLEG